MHCYMTFMLLMACTTGLPGFGWFDDEPNDGKVGQDDTGALGPEDTQAGTGDDDSPGNGTDTGEDGGEVPPLPLADWTVMVFLNGDNDLEEWALDDMNEMESVGSTDRVNVIAQLDRSAGYARDDGDWTGARRYRVEKDGDDDRILSPVLDDLGDVDSGSAHTIVDFVRWTVERYPARRYALVLWDHGDGWSLTSQPPLTKGISYDYGTGHKLSIADGEFEGLMVDVNAILGGRVDLLGMDACIMQSWEIAWVAQPYADVYVASQDYESLTGWAYHTALADLVAAPDMDAATLGDAIAHRFHEIPDRTQSVIDLRRLPALDAALNDLADAAVATGDAKGLLSLSVDALGFDGTASRDHDLGDYLLQIEAATTDPGVLAALPAVQDALADVVISNYTLGGRLRAAQGLTIYAPHDANVDDVYLNAAWSAGTRWDEFLKAAAAGR